MIDLSIVFSYKGKTVTVPDVSPESTKEELLRLARQHLEISDDILLKLLHKGKIIAQDSMENTSEANHQSAFTPPTKSQLKIIVIGTQVQGVQILNSCRSDPLLRGFDDERPKPTQTTSYWGRHGKQHSQYKFCRLQECTDASFGTRPGASTPHAFEARRLLERLSTDPGVVAILTSRELVVGTLGEMDPIDDRLMQKKQQEGACLLGYNTNHGMRIDIKLRTDDLSSFRPYTELCSTLIHELSHNWVGEHNVLFWTNYAQMRVEYLWKHACLYDFVNGKRTSQLAGISQMIAPGGQKISRKEQMMENITKSVIGETAREMAQHHIPVQMIIPAILDFSKDLMKEANDSNEGGQKLGGVGPTTESTKELALAAAERRARDAKNKQNEERR